MPPRGRPRKVGLKRMDAAVENMRVLGFSDELVRATVKRLLELYLFLYKWSKRTKVIVGLEGQNTNPDEGIIFVFGAAPDRWRLFNGPVYDGDAGWLFIEESSYKLLIDTILDEQDNGLLKGDSSEGNARVDNNPSSAVMPLTGVEDAASQINEIGGEDSDPPAEEERTEEGDISLDQNPFQSPPPPISSSAPVDCLVMQKRRRFCGWISDDEPNDTNTKQLIPATAMQLERLISGTDTHSRSKWDEKPE